MWLGCRGTTCRPYDCDTTTPWRYSFTEFAMGLRRIVKNPDQLSRRSTNRAALLRLIAATVSAGNPECIKSLAGSPAEINGKSLPKRTWEPGTTLRSAESEVGLLALAVS